MTGKVRSGYLGDLTLLRCLSKGTREHREGWVVVTSGIFRIPEQKDPLDVQTSSI